jgi:hypothetical protein
VKGAVKVQGNTSFTHQKLDKRPRLRAHISIPALPLTALRKAPLPSCSTHLPPSSAPFSDHLHSLIPLSSFTSLDFTQAGHNSSSALFSRLRYLQTAVGELLAEAGARLTCPFLAPARHPSTTTAANLRLAVIGFHFLSTESACKVQSAHTIFLGNWELPLLRQRSGTALLRVRSVLQPRLTLNCN